MPPPFAQVFTLRRAEFGELRHGKHPLLAGEGQGYQLNLQILSKDMRIHNWLHHMLAISWPIASWRFQSGEAYSGLPCQKLRTACIHMVIQTSERAVYPSLLYCGKPNFISHPQMVVVYGIGFTTFYQFL